MTQFSVENGSIGSDVSIISPENTNLKKSNFTYGIQPIYYFSRIFGYMPFKLVHDSNGLIKGARITLFDILWTVFSIGLHLFATIHFLLTAGCMTENFEISVILANGTKTLVILRRLFNCLCLGMEICNRFKLVDILKKLNSFDEEAMLMLDFVMLWLKNNCLILWIHFLVNDADGHPWNLFWLCKGALSVFESLYYCIAGSVLLFHFDVIQWMQTQRFK